MNDDKAGAFVARLQIIRIEHVQIEFAIINRLVNDAAARLELSGPLVDGISARLA